MFEHIHQALSSNAFIPHGHCFLWIPSLLWLHVSSDTLIGLAYVGISVLLYLLVRTIRLPFSPVFIAFGLFIGLCGLTHFMQVWTVWNPHYWISGYLKAGTALASVATAVGLVFVKPQVQEVVYAARLSEERRQRLETTNAELALLYEKVKDLDQLKSQFFANVSHELRTPLALIVGPVERLLQDDALGELQRRQLQTISQSATSLIKQVNDLLDVAKLEAGQMQMHYAAVDLVPYVRLIASQFELAAEQKGLGFQVTTPASLTAEVDPDMLERVVINLLSNAIKFTPADGEITLTLTASDDYVQLVVSDTGPGIAPEHYATIFERFRQIEGGSTREHGGTGLGLAIAKDFVDLHRGSIDVAETTGGGATFIVKIPRHAPAGTEIRSAPTTLAPETQSSLQGSLQELSASRDDETADTLPQEAGRPRVLVVEDNPDMRAFIAEILSNAYNVVAAEDGETGLRQAEALRPDLIISDIMMPRFSGDHLVHALRERQHFDATPILLLSAKADDALRVELLRSGAQDFVHKPFLPSELEARVANLVSIKRAADTLRTELATVSTDLEALAQEVALRNRQLRTALDGADVAREQAERASMVKTYFLGIISHELRTPLSTVLMNMQLLSRELGDAVPVAQQWPATRRRLDRVAAAARQLHSLIEGLLEYTRIESGRINVHVESVDIEAIAEEVVAEQRPADTALKVVLQRTEKPTAPIQSDARLLRVILSNLVGNAVKFTTEGTIIVCVERTEDGVELVVQDTGLGIPADALDRIFEPFEQLEPLQRKSTPGMGLGLALVKEIAEALGGRVVVSSEVGIGSRFTVSLPEAFRDGALTEGV